MELNPMLDAMVHAHQDRMMRAADLGRLRKLARVDRTAQRTRSKIRLVRLFARRPRATRVPTTTMLLRAALAHLAS